MEKARYKIGQVAEILKLRASVLRFWETEFPQLAPLRTKKGARLYTDKDIALLRKIQNLLHEQGLTIDGARRVLADTNEQIAPNQLARDAEFMRFLKNELLEARNLLASSQRNSG